MVNPDPWIPTPYGTGLPDAVGISIARVTGSTGSYSYELMGNLEAMTVVRHEGATPSVCTLRYIWDSGIAGAPDSMEDALSTGGSFTKALNAGDRILVVATGPSGVVAALFDGHAMDFSVSMAGEHEEVHVECEGVEARCKDAPITVAPWRKANAPSTVADVVIGRSPTMNPNGRANASPSGANSGASPNDYPVFLDENYGGGYPVGPQVSWTLPMAARLLCGYYNSAQTYVKNPSGATLDSVLVGRNPITGTTFDPNNSASYTTSDILIPNKPLLGKSWVDVLQDVMAGHGFGMAFPVTLDGSGNPSTSLKVYLQQGGQQKPLWLQTRGSELDTTLSNLGSAEIDRDCRVVANSWFVNGAPKRYEVSFILTPAFPSDPSDCTSANLPRYNRTAEPAFTNSYRDAYRKYVFDEAGEGHYLISSSTAYTNVIDLSPIFGSDAFTVRRRKPIGELISVDAVGRKMHARLAYTTTYPGSYPKIWDGTATWQEIGGGFNLLHDQIGIWVNVQNPNNWHIGTDANGGPLILKGIEDLVSSASRPFYLRLTVVIEGDQPTSGSAAMQAGITPLSFPITRVVDAADRYRTETIVANSEFNCASGATNQVKRDDTPAATAEAIAFRVAHEAGILNGDVEIPYVTNYWGIGDLVPSIQGRSLGLRTDGNGGTPVYPSVTAIRWLLDGEQKTILTISDSGIARKTRKAGFGKAPRYQPSPIGDGSIQGGGFKVTDYAKGLA